MPQVDDCVTRFFSYWRATSHPLLPYLCSCNIIVEAHRPLVIRYIDLNVFELALASLICSAYRLRTDKTAGEPAQSDLWLMFNFSIYRRVYCWCHNSRFVACALECSSDQSFSTGAASLLSSWGVSLRVDWLRQPRHTAIPSGIDLWGCSSTSLAILALLLGAALWLSSHWQHLKTAFELELFLWLWCAIVIYLAKKLRLCLGCFLSGLRFLTCADLRHVVLK